MAHNDAVNSPSHYTQGGIECIDAMVAAHGRSSVYDYCILAATKYLWRHKLKNGVEDLQKAVWYINKAIELKENHELE